MCSAIILDFDLLQLKSFVFRRSGIHRSFAAVRSSFWQFVKEHISEPFWGIYNELVHNQPLTVTDANALADSSQRYGTVFFLERVVLFVTINIVRSSKKS